ncbi:MAG: metallophosphoesterase [Bacillota bacterium]|nr:metallophosphoesterase [Bacillota bacterium]
MKKTLMMLMAVLLPLLLLISGCADKQEESCDFIFVSDSQSAPGSLDYAPFAALLRQALEQPADLLLHGGDIINDGADAAELQAFAAACGDELRALRWYISLGNHDDISLAQRFELPENRYDDTRMLVYSADCGAAHILVLDGNYLGVDDAALREWVRADLAAADSASWKIVVSHYSLYPFTDDAKDIQRAETQRELWESVLVEGGVDLFLSGHQHHYSRSEEQNGVVYMTVASGGKGGYTPPADTGGAALLLSGCQCWQRYHLDGATLEMTAYDAAGNIIDSLTLSK